MLSNRLIEAPSFQVAKKGSRLLTAAEVAERLRCSKAQVSKVMAGKVKHLPSLPTVRIGRRILVRDNVLNRWIEEVEAGYPVEA
jgi:transcriptional regulator with XRE-family HTH domain